ncbi:MAG: hypothetical protein ACI9VI_003534 [Candidatus Azotimanducaceae bacterium]|jgi:hypothetical protein
MSKLSKYAPGALLATALFAIAGSAHATLVADVTSATSTMIVDITAAIGIVGGVIIAVLAVTYGWRKVAGMMS